MAGLSDLWYLTCNREEISSLISRRQGQIIEQKRIDELLREKCSDCPETVSELLLAERKLNYTSSKSFINRPNVEHYMENLKDMCQTLETHHTRLFDILSGEGVDGSQCELLSSYIEEFKRET